MVGQIVEILKPADLITFDAGRPVHRVPDEVFTLRLREHLFEFVGWDWYACMIRSGGQGAWAPSRPYLSFSIDEEQRQWLQDLVVRLNVELHAGGCWIGAWGNTNHFEVLFRDADGDLQLTNGEQNPFARLKAIGHDAFMDHCALAIQMWQDTLKQMEIKPDDMIKAAQGQTRPDQ